MTTTDGERHVDIIGLPMDLGADRRGVDMGPTALRIAGLQSRLESMGYVVSDLGDIRLPGKESLTVTDQKLKYLDEIVRASEILAVKVEDSLNANHFPLCIGGDHSIAIGSIAGVSSYCRKNALTLGVIWIDAHTDMNTDSSTPTGNIHGMPLSASLGIGSNYLTEIMGFSPKLRPEHCALIGVRSIDDKEKQNIRVLKLPLYTMTDIDRWGMYRVIDEVLTTLKERVDHIHLSFDIDSVDPSIAKGVGTPVPGGLTYRETHLIMEIIAERGGVDSMDIAEINPVLDNKNESAEFAVAVTSSVMGKRIL